ncbi:MAG: hypothetical protein KF699_06355 [Phycisphaeraceae bacterium]|nr:hypothetical protein [Phycisphaeraceae bacterium]
MAMARRRARRLIAALVAVFSAVACMVLYIALSIVLPPPRQYYPVMTLRADLRVSPESVRVLEPNEPAILPDLARMRAAGEITSPVSATIRLLRPIPRRSLRHFGHMEFSVDGLQPTYDEMEQAGPERSIEVELAYLSIGTESESGEFTKVMVYWPKVPRPVGSMLQGRLMDPAMVERVLPVLSQWTLEMSGDQEFADGVREGGKRGPPPPGGTGDLVRKVFKYAAFIALSVAVLLLLTFGKQRNPEPV